MRQAILILFVVVPGMATVLVCGYFLVKDWVALSAAFARFESVVANGGDLRRVVIAQAYQ